MSYFLAPALVALRDELNARFPNRDKSSDGWIGDASHAASVSDHNPDWSAGGVVRAIDVDVDDNDPHGDIRTLILETCIGDPRVWYVISNGVIYSRTYGWAARTYTGSNPHNHHVHISLRGVNDTAPVAAQIAADTTQWIAPEKPRTRPLKVSLAALRVQFDLARAGKPVKRSAHVRRAQRALNQKYGKSLVADGLCGPLTLQAWARHERAIGVFGHANRPDKKSLAALVAGRFQAVA